jgi:hypothetical protein
MFSTLLALAGVLVVVAVTELVCWSLLRLQKEYRVDVVPPDGLYIVDADLGYRGPSSQRVHVTKRLGDRLVYDAVYQFDDAGRRATPAPRSPNGRSLLVFGCSYAFGEGVQDHEALPYLLASSGGEHVYNYAFPGYGPNSALARLQSGDLEHEVAERSGTALYVFIDHHIQRAIGSLHVHLRWAADFPFYELRGGRLVRHGSFRGARPLRSALYELVGLSNVVRYVPLDWPRPIRTVHYELTARILSEVAREARERLGAAEFRVVFFPGTRAVAEMAPRLQRLGVPTLDYSELLDYELDGYRYLDSHPKPEVHRLLADQLVTDLGLDGAAIADSASPAPAG